MNVTPEIRVGLSLSLQKQHMLIIIIKLIIQKAEVTMNLFLKKVKLEGLSYIKKLSKVSPSPDLSVKSVSYFGKIKSVISCCLDIQSFVKLSFSDKWKLRKFF